ncbi:Hypothetical predicted protein [Paramuricea clavata]|uniref:Pentraxin (PTX) domain-containing protein n=1 Tax=Paramuricea clavata TaxID=317549 RepID=A0A6S7FIG0_PARCT|nr:Hypothetical predicted protein [Paramuricea clavata]
MSKIAQTNVWNHVLPNEAITAMSYGGTSIEENLLRWSDVVASYNSDAYFTQHPFHLYLPDGVVQKRRDEFCRKNAPICPSGNTHYARIGPRHTNDPPGIQWRCYCPVNVGEDKNVQVVNDKYHTYEQLMYIF